MRNDACPAGYQDEDGDGICQLCTTARDCGPGAKFIGAVDGDCTSAKDNTCEPCQKPLHSKFGTEEGHLTSGTCSHVCTDGYTHGPGVNIYGGKGWCEVCCKLLKQLCRFY
jgi:hypothetical protein